MPNQEQSGEKKKRHEKALGKQKHELEKKEERADRPLPSGWNRYLDKSSGDFYYVGPDGTTQWDQP